ncbi:MAG: hypothetical protein ACHQAQ_05730 [Hyphomicrobiales bacterium]
MRASSILAIAILTAGALASAPAEAASHRYRYRAPLRPPLVVPVAPRSFLDPGPIVPVGSLSSYVYVSQYPYSMPYSNRHYGEPPLPSYGDGGRPLFERLDFGPLSGP